MKFARVMALGLWIGIAGGCSLSSTPGKITRTLIEYDRGYSFPTHSDMVITTAAGATRFSDISLDGSPFFPDNSIIPNAFFKPLFRLDFKGVIGASTEPYYGIRIYHFFEKNPHWGLGLDFIHFKVFMADRQQAVSVTGPWPGVSSDGRVVLGDQFESLNVSHGVNHIALTLTYRWMLLPSSELPEGRCQPFISVGAGPAVPHLQLIAKQGDQLQSLAYSYQWRLGNWGMGVGAGLRWKISPGFGLYGEYKWTYSSLDNMHFDAGGDGTVKMRFSDHHVVWGISVIF